MVTIGNHYFYKGQEFVVIGLTSMKFTDKDGWVDAVQYVHLNDVDSPNAETFVREKADFEYNFIPAVLEVDTKIAYIENGKVIDTYSVTVVEDDNALAENKDGVELVFLAGVNSDGGLTVVSPLEELELLFYVLMPDMQKRMTNRGIVDEMEALLVEGIERIGKINVSGATHDLQESKNSLSQTLEIIYAKLGV